jgi:hypothetical protein
LPLCYLAPYAWNSRSPICPSWKPHQEIRDFFGNPVFFDITVLLSMILEIFASHEEKAVMKLGDWFSSWVRDQVESAGAAGVLVRLSGGIDSAVVAVLAKGAMRDNVLALLLPCRSLVEDDPIFRLKSV